jgi:hypothetical protein
MKRKVKNVFLIATLAAAVTGILCWPPVLKYLVQSNLQNARKQGSALSWSGLSTGMTSTALESLTVWIPGPRVKGSFKLPISLELHNVAVALKLSSLLSLHPAVTYSSGLYGGSLEGEAQTLGDTTRINARFNNVELGSHPQLATFGVRGGVFSGTFEDFEIVPQGPRQGAFSFSLRELAPPAIDAAKSLLRVEDFGAFDLEATGAISPDAVEVPTIHLSSKFGEVSGNLKASDHLSGSPLLSGHFDIALSDQGATTFGAWLPFIPGSGLDASTRKFSVNATRTACSNIRDNSAVLNLGNGCVKLVFVKS